MTTLPSARMAADPYDSAWKAGLDGFLPQMMELLFPAAFAEIDWSMPVVSLNSELPNLALGHEAAGRIADSLYQVTRRGGREHWIVIHIEVQSSPDHELAERMFVYLCRCFEKYGAKVFGFAVLGDLQPSFRPAPFGWELGEGRLLYQFESAKLIDFRDRIAELEASDNPFALIVLAHLYTKETRHDQARRRGFKLNLIRLLVRRRYPRERIHKIFQIIDWLMRLDPEHTTIFRQELESLREDTDMDTYVNTIQFFGRIEGAQQEAEKIIRSLLVRRFGDLPSWASEKIAGAKAETLERWSLQLLDAGRLEDVFA